MTSRKNNLSFSYGKKSIQFDSSGMEECRIFSPRKIQTEGTEKEIVKESLANPIGSPTLSFLLDQQNPSKVTVVLSDITRITGSQLFLPLLNQIFQERRISPRKITYLIASGIHPPCSKEQLETLLGIKGGSGLKLEEAKAPYRYRLTNGSAVIQHSARDEKALKPVGAFVDGTPLKIHKLAADSDFLILTGSVTLHYLAGFGGGRKAILPGISSYESCMELHKLSLCKQWNRKNRRASLGNIRGNPVHQRMEEAAKMVSPAFLLNTVCDDHGKIIHAVSGHWKKAFQKGTGFVRKAFCRESDSLFDAAIVSCGGFPKDINFIQSHKTFENCIGLVKEGGALLLIAECREEIGNPDFLKWFRFPSEEKFVKSLKENFVINGQTALSTFNKCKRVRTYMLTNLDEKTVRTMNIHKVASIQEFIEREKLEGKKVALVPNGSTTWFRSSR